MRSNHSGLNGQKGFRARQARSQKMKNWEKEFLHRSTSGMRIGLDKIHVRDLAFDFYIGAQLFDLFAVVVIAHDYGTCV